MLGYATIMDLRAELELIITEERYHVILTRIENGEMISSCYGNGIKTVDVVESLKKGE